MVGPKTVPTGLVKISGNSVWRAQALNCAIARKRRRFDYGEAHRLRGLLQIAIHRFHLRGQFVAPSAPRLGRPLSKMQRVANLGLPLLRTTPDAPGTRR